MVKSAISIFLLASTALAQMGGVAPGGPAGVAANPANPAGVANVANGANAAGANPAAQPADGAAAGAQVINVPGQAAPPAAPGAGAAPAVAAPPPPVAPAPVAAPVSLDSYTVTKVIEGVTTVEVRPMSATTAYRTTVIGGLLTTQPFQYVQTFAPRFTSAAAVPAGSIGLGTLSSKGEVGSVKQPIYVTIMTTE